jgi:hypothetical protein
MAVSNAKVYLDWGQVDDGCNDLLVANSYALTTESGVPVLDSDQEPVADWEAFNTAVVTVATSLKAVGVNGIKPEAGSYHNLLITTCPNWPFDYSTTQVPEEKAIYERMVKSVARYTATGITGKCQQALNRKPGGKIILRGSIMTKNGEVDGIWLSINDSPTGDIQNNVDARLEKVFKSLKPAREYINLVSTKQPGIAAQTLISLDSTFTKLDADWKALRAGVALQVKAIGAGNGSAAVPADDEDDDVLVNDE